MMTETLEPIDPRTLDRPKGRYRIELFDAESGVLVETRTVDNYISPVYELNAIGLQHVAQWTAAGMANNSVVIDPDSSTVSAKNILTALAPARFWNPLGVPALPMDALLITNDDTAEDTNDAWLRGLLVAHASRWKATVPASGKRGQINEAESTLSNVGQTHKTVWDFTTQQGNGEFQTLAIGSMTDHDTTTAARFWTALGPKCIVFDDSIVSAGASAGYAISSNLFDDGTNVYYLAMEDNATTGDIVLRSLPSASVWGAADHATEPFAQDAGGLTPTLVCDTGINTGAIPGGNNTISSPVYFSILGLVKLSGGDFVMAWVGYNSGTNTSNNGRTITIRRFTAAGSQVWSTSPCPVGDANANGGAVMCVDGSDNIYVGYPAGNAADKLYRIDPATGALSATLAAFPDGAVLQAGTGGVGQGMDFDGTDILVWTNKGILKVSTAGAPVSPFNYGYPADVTGAATAVSPWNATASRYGAMGRGQTGVAVPSIRYVTTYAGSVSAPQAGSYAEGMVGESGVPNQGTSIAPNGINVKAGKLWVLCRTGANPSFAPSGPVMLMAVTGANFFSRVVLDSPITKNTSQNMKITYELTWPGHDPATWPAHQDI